MLKSYKYRIYPTKVQEGLLELTLDRCRFLYNCALEQRIFAFKQRGQSVNYHEQAVSLPQLKKDLPEFKEVHSQVLQNSLKRLDKAYDSFFRRVKQGVTAGFPRFQGKHRFNSFTYPQYKALPTEHIYLPKIGNVRILQHRPIDGIIKTCTVKREVSDWYVTFSCEVINQPLPKTGKEVGIDRGITVALATSDGEMFENPRYYTKAQKALRKANRKLARRKRGSNRRELARLTLAKLHLKVKRQRADYLHKLSAYLISNYDVLVFEDLNVAGMSKSNLAKHILDVGWSQLMQFTNYKAEYADRQVLSVKPHYSSQECCVCGHIAKENRKTQSKFECVECGHKQNADINAANVILGRGHALQALTQGTSLNVA